MPIQDKRYFNDEQIADIRSRYRVERTVDEALTWKLQRRRGDDYILATEEELFTRLQGFLASRLDGEFEVFDLSRVPGGGSKEMFKFKLKQGEQTRGLILRMNPGESIVETHRLREFQVIAAMKGVVPVPDVFWVDVDGSELGSGAMICGFVEGVAKPSEPTGGGGAVSGIGSGFPQPLREKLSGPFVEHLVAIHQFDWRNADLSSLDVPRAHTLEVSEWCLDHWSRVWEEDSFEPHPVMALARNWLKENMPVTEEIRVIHNDYRNGNFMFDERSGEITAILDWELARLGDIHEDLAWVLFPGFSSPDESGKPMVCGLLSRESFIERYEQLSGNKIDQQRLHYYTIMNLYKLAVLGYASNVRAASDRQTHLDVMMNLSAGLGCSSVGGLYQLMTQQEAC
ncbi:MAG: phosphotransferase family protein [Pseudomonadales bacterium]|nr:phosphotransferase family protein [Pseudomonadales bacterium]MCP5171172.1 phosphotransferase family protein [Pseudomonadales bacterium]MCP5301590.1 phosphotransferase family protein [Pseudomonadales bacterium]